MGDREWYGALAKCGKRGLESNLEALGRRESVFRGRESACRDPVSSCKIHERSRKAV